LPDRRAWLRVLGSPRVCTRLAVVSSKGTSRRHPIWNHPSGVSPLGSRPRTVPGGSWFPGGGSRSLTDRQHWIDPIWVIDTFR
jgi:hypothetical protein